MHLHTDMIVYEMNILLTKKTPLSCSYVPAFTCAVVVFRTRIHQKRILRRTGTLKEPAGRLHRLGTGWSNLRRPMAVLQRPTEFAGATSIPHLRAWYQCWYSESWNIKKNRAPKQQKNPLVLFLSDRQRLGMVKPISAWLLHKCNQRAPVSTWEC